MAITKGTWFNLPDAGITEYLFKNSLAAKTDQVFRAAMINPNQSNLVQTPPPQTPPPGNSTTQKPAVKTVVPTTPTGGQTQQVLGSQQPQSSTPDMSQQINDMYGPAFNALSDIETLQPQLQQTAITGLTNQKSAMQEAYDALNTNTQTLFGNQKSELLAAQTAGENKSVRDLNASQQRANSTYGRGSSTGGAISEILLGEFLRNGGDLRSSYASGQKVIFQKERELQADFSMKTAQLEKDFQQAVRETNDTFHQRIAEIGLKKAALEQEKSVMKLEALKEAIADSKTLAAYKDKAMFDLGVWNMQKKAELGETQTYLDDITAKVAAEMKARETEMQNTTTGSLLGMGSPEQQNSPFYKQPSGYKDPFENLLT